MVPVYSPLSMVLFIGLLYWSFSLVSFIGPVHWPLILVLFIGLLYWSSSLASFIGPLDWSFYWLYWFGIFFLFIGLPYCYIDHLMYCVKWSCWPLCMSSTVWFCCLPSWWVMLFCSVESGKLRWLILLNPVENPFGYCWSMSFTYSIESCKVLLIGPITVPCGFVNTMIGFLLPHWSARC